MNQFAKTLKELAQNLKIKNIVLAQYVQYDVSYISKWLGGKTLPTEKNIDRVISGIADCVLSLKDEELYIKAGLPSAAVELRKAVEKKLLQAYQQSRILQNPPQTEQFYIAEEDLVHTVARINEMENQSFGECSNLIAADLFAMGHESRLSLAKIQSGRFAGMQQQQSHQIKMLVDLGQIRDIIYDCIFLIHMLTSYSAVDLQLHHGQEARDKLIYVRDHSMLLSSMLIHDNQSLSISVLNDGEAAHSLYQKLIPLCTQENLLFRHTEMEDLLHNNQYTRTLLSNRLRWLVGHITEQFLPDSVFESLLSQMEGSGLTEQYSRANSLRKSVFRSSEIHIMLYDSALANLMLSGEVDFFNQRVCLTMQQRLDCLSYIRELIHRENVHLRLIQEGFSSDFKFITNPCLFLSDTTGYLRLENDRYQNNILLLSDRNIMELFGNFYSAIWDERKDVVVENCDLIDAELNMFMDQLNMMNENEM